MRSQDGGPKRVRSVPGILGGVDHYDAAGNYLGYSVPGIFGGVDHYKADGSYAGYSIEGIIGGTDHYDAAGNHRGYSSERHPGRRGSLRRRKRACRHEHAESSLGKHVYARRRLRHRYRSFLRSSIDNIS